MKPSILQTRLCYSPVEAAQDENTGNVWYFAYGSNMSAETFRSHRGIKPLAAIPVCIPGWTLTFDIYGIPYQEPSFSCIAPSSVPTVSVAGETTPVVRGTAYLVDLESYYSIIASEGGGTAYKEVELLAERTHRDQQNMEKGSEEKREQFSVMTLTRAYGPTTPRCPSQRYKDIMLVGARQAQLPLEYQRYLHKVPSYQPARSGWRLVGATLFLSTWVPIMSVVERLVNSSANFDGKGNCPAWVQKVVRLVLLVMWFYHDWIHAGIWGRGDGLDQTDANKALIEDAGQVEKGGEIYLE